MTDTDAAKDTKRLPDPEVASLASSLGIGTAPPELDTPRDYFYAETRVVERVPDEYYAKQRRRAEDTAAATAAEKRGKKGDLLARLKSALASPAVERHRQIPQREGKFYHVNEKGEIVETTVRRAGLYLGFNVVGGDVRQQIGSLCG
jgi:hypothetical protein